jgi:hypothetical protein
MNRQDCQRIPAFPPGPETNGQEIRFFSGIFTFLKKRTRVLIRERFCASILLSGSYRLPGAHCWEFPAAGSEFKCEVMIMAQLKMYWKNDGTELPALSLPAGVSVQSLPEPPNGLDTWKDVIRYMSKNFDTDTSGDYYDRSMLQQANYNENMCYIFSVDGEPAATVTVIFCFSMRSSPFFAKSAEGVISPSALSGTCQICSKG